MTNSGRGQSRYSNYEKIALFDSGVGGLSVLRQLAATLPGVDFVYLGDTARLPYGNRSRTEITSFVEEIVGYLSRFRPQAVVMACNTSAALARDAAVKCAVRHGFEVFNLIEPTAEYVGQSAFSSVAVLATEATAKSGAFARALEAVNFSGKITEVGCPKLVPLIESGRLGEPDIEAQLACALQEYLLQIAGAEAIVLGCTHFPFVADRIEALVKGPLKACFLRPVTILDPAVVLSARLRAGQNISAQFAPDVVLPHEAVNRTSNTEIFTTGSAQAFSQTARVCLGRDLVAVKHLSLSLLTGEKVTGIQPIGQFLPA